MKKLLCSLAGVVAVAISAQAGAVPVTFDISGHSTAAISDFDGLGKPSITMNPKLDLLSDTLSVGEEFKFLFFSIAFPTIGLGSGTVSASLAFDAPSEAWDAIGEASGSFLSVGGTIGSLKWDTQPGLFALPNGATYSVRFQDLIGVTASNVDVHAYLTLRSEGAPEPGTLVLLGLGVLGVALASRRRLAPQGA